MSVATRRRARVRVEGTVQGVGFRPYVHRLAGELGLAGYVLNDSRGVLLEIEGPGDAVETFLTRLGPDAPPLAVLESLTVADRQPTGDGGFEIRPSPHGERADVPVTPDSATCDDCLRELLDPSDRRYRYPFINCTNCGPRFTIVRGVPYDRPLTTMAGFRMCDECRTEYEDPRDRRFHAQPNACPRCGPSLSLLDADGRVAARDVAALAAAVDALRGGAVVAIKGIGGYHLACRADDEAAVGALRMRKHREDKPFALMVGSLGEAERLVDLGDAERRLMSGPQRPIVLAARRLAAPIAPAVAPGALELGVMLPYSPLHHLLLRDCGTGALVMTSGNVSDEPIAYRDEDAIARLGAIADLLPRPRPPDRDAHRRLGRACRGGPAVAVRAALAGVRARGADAARRHAAPGARLRRRAEEHVLPGARQPGLGRAPHRRSGELRDARVVHRGDRALRAAVRGRARGRGPRSPSGIPVDEVRTRSRRRRADRRTAPPRAPCGMPRRAR